MGYYIETPENQSKAKQLCELHSAETSPVPGSLAEIAEDKALICVISNGRFDAAALVYSDRELRDFQEPGDNRPRTWLLMDKALAHRLAGYED